MDNIGRVRGFRPQQLCSRCGREPRYPNQRWGAACFRSYKRTWRRQQRERRAMEGAAAGRPTNIIQHQGNTSRRWSPTLIEQLKRVVVEVPKYPHRPETIRVSLIPRGEHCYVDLRVYRAGRPTRQGLVIHCDHLPAVIRGLQQARHATWDALPKPEDLPVPVQRRGQTAVHWPEWP